MTDDTNDKHSPDDSTEAKPFGRKRRHQRHRDTPDAELSAADRHARHAADTGGQS